MYLKNQQVRYQELYFTTATVLHWKHLLRPDKYKQIITESFQFLAAEKAVWIYAFVIMPNHFHWVWQMREEATLARAQLRLMKFVAQNIKFDLAANHPRVLPHFKVERKDRQCQFFKERPLSVPIFTNQVA